MTYNMTARGGALRRAASGQTNAENIVRSALRREVLILGDGPHIYWPRIITADELLAIVRDASAQGIVRTKPDASI
jgi:hypothetical protein